MTYCLVNMGRRHQSRQLLGPAHSYLGADNTVYLGHIQFEDASIPFGEEFGGYRSLIEDDELRAELLAIRPRRDRPRRGTEPANEYVAPTALALESLVAGHRLTGVGLNGGLLFQDQERQWFHPHVVSVTR